MELIVIDNHFEFIKFKKVIYNVSKHLLIIPADASTHDMSNQCNTCSSLFNYNYVNNDVFNEYLTTVNNTFSNTYLVHHTHPGQHNPGHILERTLSDLILLAHCDTIESVLAIDFKPNNITTFYNVMKHSFYNYNKSDDAIIKYTFPERKNEFILLNNVIVRYRNMNFLLYLYKHYIQLNTMPNIKVLKLLQTSVLKYINYNHENKVIKKSICLFHPIENTYKEPSRNAGRKIVNIDEIRELLTNKGYTVTVFTCDNFKKLNIVEQILLFQTFNYFISPFGSSFIISLFCPYMKNICLVPYKYKPLDFWNTIFNAVRHELNIDVRYVECEGVKWYDNDNLFTEDDYKNKDLIQGGPWSRLAVCNLIINKSIVHELDP